MDDPLLIEFDRWRDESERLFDMLQERFEWVRDIAFDGQPGNQNRVQEALDNEYLTVKNAIFKFHRQMTEETIARLPSPYRR